MTRKSRFASSSIPTLAILGVALCASFATPPLVRAQSSAPVPVPPSRPFSAAPQPLSAVASPAAAPVPPSPPLANNWTSLVNPPGFAASTPLLLTDGRVLVQDIGKTDWHLLTPDNTGSYINGNWTALAASPKQCFDTKTQALETWSPLYMASAVLPDGRVVMIGGEYNLALSNDEVWSNLGEIYDPLAGAWTCLSAPSGWNQLGDAMSIVQPNGTFLLGNALGSSVATLNLSANQSTWTVINPTGKSADNGGYNNEEGWTLLPNGNVLTLENWNSLDTTETPAVQYSPSTQSWTTAGTAPDPLVLISKGNTQYFEVGPAVLRPDGTVLATGATGFNDIYNTTTGAWSHGPTLPTLSENVSCNNVNYGAVTEQFAFVDAPAALLPDGNVLLDASPVDSNCGWINGTEFFEFDGTNLTQVAGTLNSSRTPSYEGRLLTLPNGQILFLDGTGDAEIYTATGIPNSAWAPTITTSPGTVGVGATNMLITGTQLNGLSGAVAYGDDYQAATNYPLVRITNLSTSHVFYARTHGPSTMGVATGSATESTYFDVPSNIELGPSTLVVVANGIASTSAPITVLKPGNTLLISSANPSTSGQLVTLTANVSGTSGTPTGTVTFYDGATSLATSLGTGTLNGTGVATLATTALAIGSHTITARYGGDGNFGATTSTAVTQIVNGLQNTILLASSVNPSMARQSVTFTATVTGTGGSPTGTVTFLDANPSLDGNTVLGTVALTGSTAAITITSSSSVPLLPGTHSVTAQYNGDSIFGSTTSAAVMQVVNFLTTTTTLVSAPNPSVVGQTVTFTATVTGSTGIPSGAVTIFQGTTELESVGLNGSGIATFTLSPSPFVNSGSYTFTASYGGNSFYSGSTSSVDTQVVGRGSAVSLNSSLNPSVAGQSVTFTATVTGTGGLRTGTVTFLDNGTSIGMATLNTSEVASLATTSLAVGSHPITAQYNGDSNFGPSTSTTVTQVVNVPPAITSVSPSSETAGGSAFTLTVNGTGFVNGAAVNFNGSPRITTFVNVTQLTASILATDFASVGWDEITVTNPGGGVSNAVTLTVNSGSISPIMGAALNYVPVTPCRLVDTRTTPNSAFAGPSITGGTSRNFTIPQNTTCNIPSTAAAYSLNVAVIPGGPLGFLTLWPTGQTQPVAATVSSIDGRVRSNAAIVPAGTNGAISVFASNTTNLVLDINGYFTTSLTALQFYPVTPCRVLDTRNANGPLGGPFITGNTSRTFPLPAGSCNLPGTAQAYSLNLAVVPQGPLGFLTAWPAGQAQPATANLSSTTGTVTASAAIVPAGTSGSINVYASNSTDLIIDVNGYFAPAGTGGLSLYTLPPCRVLDTRQLSDGQTTQPFSGELDENPQASACGVPVGAQAYVLNATVVPPAALGFLTLWPQGTTQPLAATLSALDATVTSNLAIVPTTNASIGAYASNPTQLVLDLFGYFALSNQAPITSISVGSDQTLSYPSSLANLPDEHTTFFPPGLLPGAASNQYLVFASSKTTGSTGGAVALETSDLINFNYATGYGDSSEGNHVMWPVLAFASCNPTYDSLYDENYSAPGSVVQDPTTGNFLIIYEAENHCPGDVNQFPFYASIGFASSTDQGKTWPELVSGSYGPNRYPALQVPGPEPTSEPTPRNYGDAIPSAYVDSSTGTPYLYVAYTYTGTPNGPATDGVIRVARAQLGGNGPLSFVKWYQGAFEQPGIGGPDSGVVPSPGCSGREAMREISRNDTYGVYMLTFVCVISVSGVQTQGAWYYSTATSLALQNWTSPQPIANSQFPITDPCTGTGTNGSQFDGWYPSLMSPGSPSGHTAATGTVFFLNGCDGGSTRVFSSRTFTISGN